MLYLIRTAILPWIAGLTVSLTSVVLGGEVVPTQTETKNENVIVVPHADTPGQPAPVIVQPQVDAYQTHRPGYWQPGGYEGRIGSPYYYSVPGGHYGGYYGTTAPTYGVGNRSGCQCGQRQHGHSHRFGDSYGHAHGSHATYGHRMRVDPYTYHFGPGYYRHAEHGHYRFPYYSYRRPWYYPGAPVFNRDTNFAW